MKIRPFQVAWGFLIVTLSVVLLLTTAEVLPWSIWLFAWQFWPMLFVVFGIALVMRRWNPHYIFGVIVYSVIFAIFAIGLSLAWQNQYFSNENFDMLNGKNIVENKVLNELPQKTKEAHVKLKLGAADLKIGSLPDENSNIFYEGTHKTNFFDLNQNLELAGDKANLTLKTGPFIKRPFYSKGMNSLDIYFSQKPLYSFDLENGASDIDINFEKLKVSKVQLDSGASKVTMRLGGKTDTNVEVRAGVSSLKLYVPKDLGFKVSSKGALVSNNFNEISLIGKKGHWESENWEKAKFKANLDFDAGASKVEIVQY